jgi:hypothetical protein
MQIQVDDFQNVRCAYHFFDEFDRFLYTAKVTCRFFFNFFDKMVNKRDCLKVILNCHTGL